MSEILPIRHFLKGQPFNILGEVEILKKNTSDLEKRKKDFSLLPTQAKILLMYAELMSWPCGCHLNLWKLVTRTEGAEAALASSSPLQD